MALTIPELGVGKKGSTKDAIIGLLSVEWPLSAKEISERVQKEVGTTVSYQAIHKRLSELEESFIVEKRDRNYALNTEWIRKGKNFFTQMETTYAKTIGKYEIDMNFDGTTTFKFSNYTDLCVTTAKLLASTILTPGRNEAFICTLEYGWWSFKFRFEHLSLILTMMLNNPQSKNIIRTDTPFGRWIRKQYMRAGGVSAPVGTKVSIDNDIFVQGEYIIEIEFSKETKEMFEHYYNKWHNLEEAFREFGLKKEPKIDATVKVTKNPSMAKFMRNELEKYFEGVEK